MDEEQKKIVVIGSILAAALALGAGLFAYQKYQAVKAEQSNE